MLNQAATALSFFVLSGWESARSVLRRRRAALISHSTCFPGGSHRVEASQDAPAQNQRLGLCGLKGGQCTHDLRKWRHGVPLIIIYDDARMRASMQLARKDDLTFARQLIEFEPGDVRAKVICPLPEGAGAARANIVLGTVAL